MKKNKLKIKYFGVPTIEYNGLPVKFPIKKLEALIFYVGYYKRAERVELVNLLWCNKDEQTGRKNLRNALYKLKSSVDIELIDFINDQIITLHSRLEVITDLPSDTEALSEKTLRLNFLNGFHIRNGENFDEWISLKRNQYQSFYNDWLLEKYQYHQTLEDIKQEKKYLKLLIEHDPYNELYYRQLMVVYQKQQRYNKGIDLYRSLVEVLDRELGIQPDAQTQSVYKMLLAEKDKPKEKVILAPESFYGRDNQLKALMQLYRDGYKNDMILIIGEAGIGKTRLKDEFTALISEEVLLVETQSYQLEQHYYLKPWSKILDKLGVYVSENEIELPENWIRMIRTVFPNFKNELALGTFLLKEQTDVLKYPELEDAVVHLFNRVASHKKIVIGADDLQWMDPLSLDLLKGVLIRCRPASVVVVATLREGHREAIDDFIALVNRRHPISEIHLHRFSKKEVKTYIELVMPSVLEAEIVEKIYAETEGNTYFLVEYVKSLKEGKALPDVLDGMRDVLHSRLMDIDEEGKKLLNIMSMFFDDISFELLNQVSSKSEMDLIELIEDLKRRNLIKEIESGGRLSYQFIHQKIREFIYRNQSSTARRIFHLKIADLLERNLTGQVRDRLLYPNLIYHFSRGGKLLKSIRYKINNAHTYLDFSHELIPENHHLQASDKASMVISNEMTMGLIKDIEATIASLDVIELSTYDAKEITLEFYHIKGRYYIREGLYDQGFESIQKALNLCLETGNNTYLMNCYLQQIYLCIQTNDLERMQSLIEEGMQIAISKHLTRKFGTMMRLKGLYYLLTKSYDKSLSCLQESINLVQKEDISPYLKDINIAAVYNYMGEIYFYKKIYDQAKFYLKQAIEVSEKYGSVNSLATFYANYAKVAYSVGEYVLARQSAEKAIEIFNLTGISWRRSIAENLLVLLELKAGNVESALMHYENGLIYTMKMKNPMEMDFMNEMKLIIRKHYGEDDYIVKKFSEIFKKQKNVDKNL